MQLISVYLYPNKVEGFINPPLPSWNDVRYRQVYQRNLKVYRGVDNRIDLHVRNSDQKPYNLTGSNIVIAIVGKETQELLIEKDCDIKSLAQGKLTVTLTANEMMQLDPGYYQYSFIKETRTIVDSTEYTVDSRQPLYIDSQYGTESTIEVFPDMRGETKASLVIREFREDIAQDGTESTSYYSSVIDANPQTSDSQTVHTFRFYMTDYTGEVVIQGTETNSNNLNNAQWTDIATYEVEASNLPYASITGKWNFLRVKHTPGKITSIAEFVVAQTILNAYTVSIRNPGGGYAVNDTITISGSRLGGETPGQNLVITVDAVGSNGEITSISWTGNSYAGVRTFVLSGDSTPSGTLDKILYR